MLYWERFGQNENLKMCALSRTSPLARCQCQEIAQLMARHHPYLSWEFLFVDSRGDKDRTTSLMSLERSDFFTDTLDRALLQGQGRIAIHSAKDLPDPLPEGLELIALTRGIDPADLLLYAPYLYPESSYRPSAHPTHPFHEGLLLLPPGARVGTSSQRRIEELRQYRPDFEFVDIRGNIQERIDLMLAGKLEAVVIAAAALYRLRCLGRIPYLSIPGTTVAGQGQLAILAQKGDHEMARLFRCIDVRTTTPTPYIYCGLEISQTLHDLPSDIHINLVPLIKTVAHQDPGLEQIFGQLEDYTYQIFTSKTALSHWLELVPQAQVDLVKTLPTLVIGKATQDVALKIGLNVVGCAQNASSEGMVNLLKNYQGIQRLVWPHSVRSRSVITDYLKERGIPYDAPEVYTTYTDNQIQLPDPYPVEGYFFASPSSVSAFFELGGRFLPHHRIYAIGKSTHDMLISSYQMPRIEV